MANTLTGKILYIYPTQQIPTKDGKTINKRSIVIDCTRYDPYTGEKSGYENTPMMEFVGDRCAELDKYSTGQVVTISFDVQGTRYTNRDGKEQIFTRVQPYKIEPRQTNGAQQQAQQQPMQQPTAQAYQQQQPMYQQPPQQQAQSFPPPADNHELPF